MFGPLGAGKLSAPPFKEAPARDRRSHGVAVALAIVLIATLVRLFFLQALGTELAFITFYPAVMIAALYAGLRGGVAATLASAVIADYFLMMPVGSLILVRSIDAVAMSLFIGSGILVSWVADQLLLSQSRLRWAETQRADQLERQVVERTATLAAEIAERRQADANLLQATAILRGIGQNSPDPIYAKDVDGRFLYANPAVLAVIGKSAKAVLGHTDVDWHADPQQAAAVMANDQRVMRGGVPEVVEESFDAAGQGLRTFRSAKSPLVLDDGSLGGILCVSFDITQAKTAEAELQLAKAEAERASLAKSKFLAAASHDLRQPVQSLTLLLSMIKRQVADKPGLAPGGKVVLLHPFHRGLPVVAALLHDALRLNSAGRRQTQDAAEQNGRKRDPEKSSDHSLPSSTGAPATSPDSSPAQANRRAHCFSCPGSTEPNMNIL